MEQKGAKKKKRPKKGRWSTWLQNGKVECTMFWSGGTVPWCFLMQWSCSISCRQLCRLSEHSHWRLWLCNFCSACERNKISHNLFVERVNVLCVRFRQVDKSQKDCRILSQIHQLERSLQQCILQTACMLRRSVPSPALFSKVPRAPFGPHVATGWPAVYRTEGSLSDPPLQCHTKARRRELWWKASPMSMKCVYNEQVHFHFSVAGIKSFTLLM